MGGPGLTEWEKWFFDQHGFLILEDVVPKDDIAQMVEVGTHWHSLTQDDLPLPLHRTGAPAFSTPAESPPGPTYINHLQYCDDAFARLVLNPEIMRVVDALTLGCQTLVDTALIKMDPSGGAKNEGGFHGELGQHVSGSNVPGEHWKDYHVTPDGEVFAGFLNCGVTLVDVPEGSGFVCIPGTHKRNFRVPDNTSEEQCLFGESIRQIDLYDGPAGVSSAAAAAATAAAATAEGPSPYRYTVQVTFEKRHLLKFEFNKQRASRFREGLSLKHEGKRVEFCQDNLGTAAETHTVVFVLRQNICPKAGSVIIFSETLRHGIR